MIALIDGDWINNNPLYLNIELMKIYTFYKKNKINVFLFNTLDIELDLYDKIYFRKELSAPTKEELRFISNINVYWGGAALTGTTRENNFPFENEAPDISPYIPLIMERIQAGELKYDSFLNKIVNSYFINYQKKQYFYTGKKYLFIYNNNLSKVPIEEIKEKIIFINNLFIDNKNGLKRFTQHKDKIIQMNKVYYRNNDLLLDKEEIDFLYEFNKFAFLYIDELNFDLEKKRNLIKTITKAKQEKKIFKLFFSNENKTEENKQIKKAINKYFKVPKYEYEKFYSFYDFLEDKQLLKKLQ